MSARIGFYYPDIHDVLLRDGLHFGEIWKRRLAEQRPLENRGGQALVVLGRGGSVGHIKPEGVQDTIQGDV